MCVLRDVVSLADAPIPTLTGAASTWPMLATKQQSLDNVSI
jgi:hypothetical protein